MLVRLVDEPSNFRLHPQQIEIIAGDRIAGDTFDSIPPSQCRLEQDPSNPAIPLKVLFRRLKSSYAGYDVVSSLKLVQGLRRSW